MIKRPDIDADIADLERQCAADEADISARQAALDAKRATLAELRIYKKHRSAYEPEEAPGEKRSGRRGGPGRPRGLMSGYKSRSELPTIPQMIVEALQDAEKRGRPSLRPIEIQGYLAHKWPGVRKNAAAAVCWKMWDDGRLVKIGDDYALPPKDAEGGDAASTLRH